MSRLGSRQTKIHEVRARNVSTAIIDHSAARALAYRQRAIELAEAARHEDDKGQRRFWSTRREPSSTSRMRSTRR
jgi:hypothetical protein